MAGDVIRTKNFVADAANFIVDLAHKALAERPRRGGVGLQSHTGRVEFRNIQILPIRSDRGEHRPQRPHPNTQHQTPNT